MTPEQELARKQAMATAEAEAAAEADAASGGAGPLSTKPSELWTASKNFVRSAGEGIAGLGDIGPQIYTAIKNAPSYSTNAAIEAAKSATPEQLKERGIDPAIVTMQPETTTPIPSPYRDLYNSQFPVPEGYKNSWSREIGNVAGPIALTLGAGNAPALVRAPFSTTASVIGDTALTTGGTIVGKETGGAIGGAIGGETGRAVGEFGGSLVGGGLTPLLNALKYNAARRLFVNEDSTAMLDAADTANVDADLSLIGNQRAVNWSRGAANEGIRRRQQQQIDQSFNRASAEVAQGGAGPQPRIDEPVAPGDVGENVIRTAQNAADRTLADANRIYDPMSEAVGPGTAVDPAITRQGLEVIVDPNNNLYTAEQKATAQHFLDQLERDSTTVLDQGVEATLQAQRARAAANLNRATPGGPLASAAQQSLDHIDELIAANRGPSWPEVRSTARPATAPSTGRSASTKAPASTLSGRRPKACGTPPIRQATRRRSSTPSMSNTAGLKATKNNSTRSPGRTSQGLTTTYSAAKASRRKRSGPTWSATPTQPSWRRSCRKTSSCADVVQPPPDGRSCRRTPGSTPPSSNGGRRCRRRCGAATRRKARRRAPGSTPTWR